MSMKRICILLALFCLLFTAGCTKKEEHKSVPASERVQTETAPPQPEMTPAPTPKPTPTPEPTPAGIVLPPLPDVDINSWEFLYAGPHCGVGRYHPHIGNVESQYMDKRCAEATVDFLNAARAQGFEVYICVAYRNWEYLLTYYENAIDYLVSAGAADEPVKVTQRFPDTPWMHFSNRTWTAPKGTGNSLYLYTTDLAPYAEMRGTYAIDRKPKVEHFANKYGALTCAYYFWQNLRDTGWDISGGYADIDRGGYVRGADFVPAYKAGTPQVLGQSASPVLAKIVRQTNVLSDNFYAEALFRQMGEKASGNAVYDSCRVAVYDVLEGLMESDLAGIRIEDGSGLSRLNTASPAFLVSFLRSMTRSRGFDAFLASLPQPGEGTLNTLLPKLTPAQKARIRVKSGSMDGVLCYSGYILDEQGKPARIFSLMVNGATAKTAALRETLGGLIEAML